MAANLLYLCRIPEVCHLANLKASFSELFALPFGVKIIFLLKISVSTGPKKGT